MLTCQGVTSLSWFGSVWHERPEDSLGAWLKGLGSCMVHEREQNEKD
jgi:hypothetical protein